MGGFNVEKARIGSWVLPAKHDPVAMIAIGYYDESGNADPAHEGTREASPVRASPSRNLCFMEAGANSKVWIPRRVLMTPSARAWAHGNAIAERASALGSDIVEMKTDRLTGLIGSRSAEAVR